MIVCTKNVNVQNGLYKANILSRYYLVTPLPPDYMAVVLKEDCSDEWHIFVNNRLPILLNLFSKFK